MKTPQIDKWAGGFGRDYTDRNDTSLDEMDNLYEKNFGITRRRVNAEFLRDLLPDAKILEVGCNIGNQLRLLQDAGFKRLYGIEIQDYALKTARERLPGAELRQASAFEIPYSDNYFDLVFTSGVLIHIDPRDLPRATAEIYRCTNNYIWGFEYYADNPTEVTYRGSQDLLWKMDYARFYLDMFPNLNLQQEMRLPYSTGSNVDTVFLLKKTGMQPA